MMHGSHFDLLSLCLLRQRDVRGVMFETCVFRREDGQMELFIAESVEINKRRGWGNETHMLRG